MLQIIKLILTFLILLYIFDNDLSVFKHIFNNDLLLNTISIIFKYTTHFFNTIYLFDSDNNIENFSNYKINPELSSKIPELNCLNSLFKKLHQTIIKYKNDTYYLGQNTRLDYYITLIQSNIEAVYNDDKPNLQMSYLIDTQHKILKIIHDLTFTTPGSHLPNDVQKLEHDFKQCFHKINTKLTTYNNSKFIYQDKNHNKINTNSGFIEFPDQPLPKNTYYDNHGFY